MTPWCIKDFIVSFMLLKLFQGPLLIQELSLRFSSLSEGTFIPSTFSYLVQQEKSGMDVMWGFLFLLFPFSFCETKDMGSVCVFSQPYISRKAEKTQSIPHFYLVGNSKPLGLGSFPSFSWRFLTWYLLTSTNFVPRRLQSLSWNIKLLKSCIVC